MPPLVIRIVASVGALVVLLCGLLGLGIWSFSKGDTESPNSVPVNVSNNDSNRARNTVPASGVPVTLTTARQTNSLEELKDATVFIQVQSPEGFPADVFKSAIATIRRDEHNNILTFEADHEIGPGYSGGPVVTEDGQLVGIAVAKNADADSEFVIGKWQISQALAGRSTGLTLGTIEKSEERHRYRVIVHLLDPFESVASVDVLTCPAEHLKESEPSSDGSWPRVRDEMTSEHCQIYWRPANVTASVDFSTPPSKTLIQIMLVRKDGTKWYDQPKTLQPVAPNP